MGFASKGGNNIPEGGAPLGGDVDGVPSVQLGRVFGTEKRRTVESGGRRKGMRRCLLSRQSGMMDHTNN